MNDTENKENQAPEQGREERHGERREEGRHGRHERRNFWHEWSDEQRRAMHDLKHEWREHIGRGPGHAFGHAPSFEEAEAWREFFRKTMGNFPEKHWIFGGRRFSPWHQGMDAFNPFVASLLSKGGGLLPLYVLHLVAQKPRYGNEIMEILAERTGGQWVSNPGAIYPLLTILEHQGFIEGKWEDPQKRTVRIYTITKTGQEELQLLRAVVSPKVEETIKVLQEFLMELESEPEAQPAAEGGSAGGPEAGQPFEKEGI